MGEATDRLIALAGAVHVGGYERRSKSGKMVKVGAYTRDPGQMSASELSAEFSALKNAATSQERNRKTRLVAEISKRKSAGTWDKTRVPTTPANPAKNPTTPKAKPAPTPDEKKSKIDALKQKAGKETPATTQPEVPNKSGNPKANAGAVRVRAKAAEAEVETSQTLQEAVSEVGGDFFGWEYRLKELDSLSRKIEDRATGKFAGERDPYGLAEAAIGDSLRYTALSDADNSIEMAKDIVSRLQQKGHEIIEQDNAWGEGGAYYGINMNFKAPNGTVWELQVHTPDSMERKDASHFWYDFMRDRNLPEEVRDAAKKRSAGSWIGLQKPEGWQTFGDFRPGESRADGDFVGSEKASKMDPDSVPPPHPAEGFKPGAGVEWGGWKFSKTDQGWELAGS
jgi:hypothetical protein